MRLEITSRAGFPDGRALRLRPRLARALGLEVLSLDIVDVVILEGVGDVSDGALREIFSDSVSQEVFMDGAAADEPRLKRWGVLAEITARPGVTDPVALTAREALRVCLAGSGGPASGAVVQTGVQYLIAFGGGEAAEDRGRIAAFFHNPLIQSAITVTRAEWDAGTRPPRRYAHEVPQSPASVERYDLSGMTDEELVKLSRRRLLALSLEEMRAVRKYFASAPGRDGSATDVELEMIAQTWSEHCKHKIFNARVSYTEAGADGKPRTIAIDSLFDAFIRKTTEDIAKGRPDLRSVFHDNSGVVAFDKDTLLCFKVETHNSPSALDPYGGAITGIVGVNRDIMGTGIGAKPIFNTNVLCFGFPDTPEGDIPEGLLGPRAVMEGVHRGIVDGGNQSGIPTVAGAFLFDESFLGKPLVFCGTGGILPAAVNGRPSWEKKIVPGDLAVMAGGRIGKDGIHGATFSSEALSESSPTSAVQIGDPITQKKMLDFLLEARDLGLFRGITDNGAGGLSSSLGEMASLSGGVKIRLDACPLKYAGLAPWEILVSESQERMSLAVPPDRVERFLALARKRDVEAAIVGGFTDTGRIEVTHGEKTVALVDMEFLHKGLPRMDLKAVWKPPAVRDEGLDAGFDMSKAMLAVLADPNVASKEEWVRQYDHEVQARSVVKPFVGRDRDAPSDGAVLRIKPDSWRGITVTHGVCPWYGDQDTFAMAQCAVDEAVRAHVSLGGDPDAMSALDNFCWPDPVEGPDTPDGAYKLAQLVRCLRGLADSCRAYCLPLISGKDSMKNDARIGGKKISVRPTLLVSLMGIIPDVRMSVTSDFKKPGDRIYLLGETRAEMGCTRLERFAGRRLGAGPTAEPAQAMAMYRRLHAAMREGLVSFCHDLSDGGLWAALAESALGGGLGADVDLARAPAGTRGEKLSAAAALFSETPSRLIVGVPPENESKWNALMAGFPCGKLGEVSGDRTVKVGMAGVSVARIGLDAISRAWKGAW